MAYDFQVVVDSGDPHVLADWWAETLEWQVEEQDESFIKDMVAKGFATDEETTTHDGKLVWRTGAAIRHPESRRRVLFQQVPEGKTVKNRLHLDVWVGARGATYLGSHSQGPHSWHTLADIEGNEFCVS
jgi:hypothetical protein